jgi:hypothetical protein
MENAPASTPWVLTVNASTISDNHAGDAGGGIDTDGTGKVFINTGTVISGNTSLNQGAGIWLDAIGAGGADLSLRGTLISNNIAINGPTGGIGNAGDGSVTIAGCTIANNFSGTTGGGFGDENSLGKLTIFSSVFLNNAAVGNGGGIQEGGPTTSISNSLLQGNTSGGSGGGLFDSSTTLTLQTSTMVDNTASAGGGLEVQTSGTGASGSTITNITLTNNHALNNSGTNGGGIDVPNSFTASLTLKDDTINANFADNGGGIFWAGAGGSSVIFQNTIVAQNSAGNGPDANNPAGSFTDQGGNLIGISGGGSGNTGFTAGTTQTGSVATPLNPLLGALANNGGNPLGDPALPSILQTEAPLPGSHAIDKGIKDTTTTIDERGVPRPDSLGTGTGHQDVGAYESNPLIGNAAFVETLYYDFLGRLGDVNNPNDAGAWVSLLSAGTVTPAQVANALSRSSEALGLVVDGLYGVILKRPADPAGKAAFVSFLQNGGTVEQGIVMLVTSSEYSMDTGGTDTGYILGLYTTLLGRAPSPAELAGWLAMLPTLGRAGAANGILQAAEFRSDVVEEHYGFTYALAGSLVSTMPNLLHRSAAPSAAEINGWVATGLDLLSLRADIAGTAEFFAFGSTGIIGQR